MQARCHGGDRRLLSAAAAALYMGRMTTDRVDPGEAPSRIVVAMSGGVDSAATAALLVEAGHDVIGITLQLYDHGRAVGRPGSCCAGQDIHDARRVADRLGIPHFVLDYEQKFRAAVIDDFADGYVAGETPVPCVRCNQRVKFADLLATAEDLGADALATGHYVDRRDMADGPTLWRGADHARDQSYFLFQTTAAQLARLRFPLGRLGKEETRAIARRHGLGVAGKRDSQDICFVPDGKYSDVLARLRPEAMVAGAIVSEQGQILGPPRRHRPLYRRTAPRAWLERRRAAVCHPHRAGDGAHRCRPARFSRSRRVSPARGQLARPQPGRRGGTGRSQGSLGDAGGCGDHCPRRLHLRYRDSRYALLRHRAWSGVRRLRGRPAARRRLDLPRLNRAQSLCPVASLFTAGIRLACYNRRSVLRWDGIEAMSGAAVRVGEVVAVSGSKVTGRLYEPLAEGNANAVEFGGLVRDPNAEFGGCWRYCRVLG